MKLYIAEKPTVAKDIVEALGGNFSRRDGYFESSGALVSWCVGHVVESIPPEAYDPAYKAWALDTLPLKLFPIKYQPKESTAKQVSVLKTLINRSDVKTVVHCGDPDDEGQLLVEEILQFSGNRHPVKRVLINDNTLPAVQKSLNSERDNSEFQGFYRKALARSAADAIYGFSMTRAYTVTAQKNGFKGVLPVGRVQTPTLGLVVRRWKANKSHSKSFFYTLDGLFGFADANLTARFKTPDSAPVDDKGRVLQRGWIEEVAAAVKGKNARVSAAAVKPRERDPALPFNLNKLQQQMSRQHGLSAAKTLEITQQLREKYRAITYNRSDCSYLSDEQYAEAPELVAALTASPAFSDAVTDTSIRSKAFDSSKVKAHTGIIPTRSIPDLTAMTENERNVYLAVAKQYLIQFMPPYRFEEATATIEVNDYLFNCRATKETDKGWEGWLKPAKETAGDDEEPESSFEAVSRLTEGTEGQCESTTVNEKETTPPKLFDEASLLNAMTRIADYVDNPEIKALLREKDKDDNQANGSIGTEATRATIIENLKKRLISVEKGKLIPTETGLALFDALPDVATQPDMTALWFARQQLIENGDLDVEQFINELYNDITRLVSDIRIDNLPVTESTQEGQSDRLTSPCPECGKQIVVRPKLFACTGCGFKIWSVVCEKKITVNQAEALISKGKTALIKGFKKKDGEKFDAALVLKDKKTGAIGFESPKK
ncbi:DNA topoisomerase [Pantoea sp. BAV 3049]|uniref:DNA topoisomerase n=1 Tax=Pantoea sp. BAV 3049 TaxID=2654188 RepID=UPI00131C4C36|nr:DNA topoisomerase [Pantoea sp. BAV 3049]